MGQRSVLLMKLDGTDINILKALMDNGRLSFRQIAEQVKVSVPTVSSKISNMENLGLIRGYQVILDTEGLGELSVVLLIRARPSDLEDLAERMKLDDRVRSLYMLSSARMMLMCTFIDPMQVNDYVRGLANYPEIIDYHISNITKVVKEEQRPLVEEGIVILPSCARCGKRITEHGVKVRREGKNRFYCNDECAGEV